MADEAASPWGTLHGRIPSQTYADSLPGNEIPLWYNHISIE